MNAIMQSIMLFNNRYPFVFFFTALSVHSFLKFNAYISRAQPEIKKTEIRIKNPLLES
jgi:hypothetical protein